MKQKLKPRDQCRASLELEANTATVGGEERRLGLTGPRCCMLQHSAAGKITCLFPQRYLICTFLWTDSSLSHPTIEVAAGNWWTVTCLLWMENLRWLKSKKRENLNLSCAADVQKETRAEWRVLVYSSLKTINCLNSIVYHFLICNVFQ